MTALLTIITCLILLGVMAAFAMIWALCCMAKDDPGADAWRDSITPLPDGHRSADFIPQDHTPPLDPSFSTTPSCPPPPLLQPLEERVGERRFPSNVGADARRL
jgi:hypothetical protein